MDEFRDSYTPQTVSPSINTPSIDQDDPRVVEAQGEAVDEALGRNVANPAVTSYWREPRDSIPIQIEQ